MVRFIPGVATVAATADLRRYLRWLFAQLEKRFAPEGLCFVSVTCELRFTSWWLRTNGDEDAEDSRWGHIVLRVAREIGSVGCFLIDPYGSGDGATVTFDFVADLDQRVGRGECYMVQSDRLGGLARVSHSIEADVDGAVLRSRSILS